jgi:hypothetical protein
MRTACEKERRSGSSSAFKAASCISPRTAKCASSRPQNSCRTSSGVLLRSTTRAPRRRVFSSAQRLADGSYLSHLYACERDRRHKINGVPVRVIEYRLDGVAEAEPLYRLVTTILDPDHAPAIGRALS